MVNEHDEPGNNLVPDYLTRARRWQVYGWLFSYFGDHGDSRVEQLAPDLVAHPVGERRGCQNSWERHRDFISASPDYGREHPNEFEDADAGAGWTRVSREIASRFNRMAYDSHCHGGCD